ncbi:unnamed protein product [Acidithrix sp. C25]|nr:unnamed protein product [Acidithrix sp. C25]
MAPWTTINYRPEISKTHKVDVWVRHWRTQTSTRTSIPFDESTTI